MIINTFFWTSSPDEEEGYEMEVLNQDVDEWEISPNRIELREVIGSGAFGAVWRATLSQPDGKRGKQIVAVKCFTRKIHYILYTIITDLLVVSN